MNRPDPKARQLSKGVPWGSLVEWAVVVIILVVASCAFARAVGLDIDTLGNDALQRLRNLLGEW